MKYKVYPDFLIRLEAGKEIARLLILETKGQHLAGNADTKFKEALFELLENAYVLGREAGDVELFAGRPNAMHFRLLIHETAWQPELEKALT